MKNTRLGILLAICVLSGVSSSAQAYGVGESILRVSDLKLTDSVGARYTSAKFSTLSSKAFASNLNHYSPGHQGEGGQWSYSTNFGVVDLTTNCGIDSGVPCGPTYPNYFLPFSPDGYHFVPGVGYRYADQLIKGDLIISPATPMSIDTRGDAATNGGNGYYGGSSLVQFDMTFKLASADRLTLSFDADAFSKVSNNGSGVHFFDRAASQVKFEARLVNTTTGAQIFSFAPDELNFLNAPWHGDSVMDPAAKSFSVSSSLLNTSDEYAFSFTQLTATFASATAVPEPSGVAMLGAGIGLLAFLRRRSHKSAALGCR
ncbi:EDSAP-1 family PEP-CTERM protein [Rugamonas rubra]|uniref:PEP-CTERM protein-sorting domain-containing protein n=1 Tax=Rugamonas rubra TaxID=758825 RepID=A0A1I4L1L6_9BURK|nr:EDSAP-1 family PEP-CTERM protein [Rugamonas rubra]SFL84719.1 PEP-CTERM protein-sorting domain-containing protein [Rugamonas rubra]